MSYTKLLRLEYYKEQKMFYTMWPGAYSFKEEIGLFLDFFKKQLKFLIEEIEKTEEAIEKKAF